MPSPAKDLLARATPEMLEEAASYAEAMVRSIDVNPTTQNRVSRLTLLAALARAVAKAERDHGEFDFHFVAPFSVVAALASLLRSEDTHE